jgi:hypothetical protein
MTVSLICRWDKLGNELDEPEVTIFPGKFVVCDECSGRGTYVNPAVSVVTPEEFAEDPEFREAYFRGDYDRCCPECKGKRVVLGFDEPEPGHKHWSVWSEYLDALAEQRRYERDCAAERRYLGMS